MPKTRKRGSHIEVASAMSGGTAKLKKKIRDVERLLRREKLPATTRTENERALVALKIEMEAAKGRNKERHLAKKYHMVRFFERKKAVRKLKQAQKTLDELSADPEKKKEAKKQRKVVKHCQIDLAYTVLFPKSEKYISLFPNENDEEAATATEEGKQRYAQAQELKRKTRKHMEELIDADKLPFSMEDLLAGKGIELEPEAPVASETKHEEIDAPQKADEEEEDDFFE
ncbi:rRNA-processing protein Efg1p [Diutina catenulata]